MTHLLDFYYLNKVTFFWIRMSKKYSVAALDNRVGKSYGERAAGASLANLEAFLHQTNDDPATGYSDR